MAFMYRVLQKRLNGKESLGDPYSFRQDMEMNQHSLQRCQSSKNKKKILQRKNDKPQWEIDW